MGGYGVYFARTHGLLGDLKGARCCGAGNRVFYGLKGSRKIRCVSLEYDRRKHR